MLQLDNKKVITLNDIASMWLFPGLIFMIVLNEQSWLGNLGQVIGWFNILAVMVILYFNFANRLIVVLFFIIVISSKLYSVINPSASYVYIFFLNLIFCVAGAVISYNKENMVYNQVIVICILNLLFMIMQISGVGEWTNLLASTWAGGASKVPGDLFFASFNEMLYDPSKAYNVYQARPRGLTHSNTILQLILMFGLALHFSKEKGRFYFGTIVLSLMVVLTMSKNVFLVFFLMCLILTLKSKKNIRVIILTLSFVCVYAYIFPGLFQFNLGLDYLRNSMFFRINDLVDAIGLTNQLDWLLDGTPRMNLPEGEHVSGLPILLLKIIKNFHYFVILSLLSIPAVMLYLKYLKKYFIHKRMLIIFTFVVIVFYPLVFPIWKAQIYWFIGGFALSPFCAFLNTSFLKERLSV